MAGSVVISRSFSSLQDEPLLEAQDRHQGTMLPERIHIDLWLNHPGGCNQ